MRLVLVASTACVLLAASPMATYADSGSSTKSDAAATSLPFEQGLADRRAYEAEYEIDLATHEIPLPDGHTLTHTPDTGSTVTSGVRLP